MQSYEERVLKIVAAGAFIELYCFICGYVEIHLFWWAQFWRGYLNVLLFKKEKQYKSLLASHRNSYNKHMYIVYIHELALSRSPIAWFIFLPNVLLGLQIVLHIYGWCARVYVLLYKTKQTRRVHVRNVCKKKNNCAPNI